MNLPKSYKISLIGILVLGLITPFIHYLHVIEMFFMLIPIIIIFFGTLLFMIISLFSADKEFKRNALLWFLPIFIFIFSQFTSVFIVDKLFNVWSKNLIYKIETFRSRTGEYPDKVDKVANYIYGIDYKLVDQNEYKLEYNRGFFVREVYSNKEKSWKSFGWND